METRKQSINKPVSSGSMSIDENEDKSSHEDMTVVDYDVMTIMGNSWIKIWWVND